MSCVIVIPVYKNEISSYEQMSLIQAKRMLGGHDIVFVCPEGLDLHAYLEIIPSAAQCPFDPSFFDSLASYNRLMLNPGFYKAFEQYAYILIYQIDAWVFSNELNEWCAKDYDYIGAPWIGKHFNKMFRDEKHLKLMPFLKNPKWWLCFKYRRSFRVGNGGFSLRKVQSMLTALEKFKEVLPVWDVNEDHFWGMYVPYHDRNFRIPDIREAARFSIENSPRKVFRMNLHKLPFGCHAWFNGMFYPFWKEHIH